MLRSPGQGGLEEGGEMARSIDTMRKPELVAEGARLGLGSRAALSARQIETLRAQVRAALQDERGGR